MAHALRTHIKTCNYCTIIDGMPVIRRFTNCVLRINLKDHAPPHFHIVMNDGREVWVRIDPAEIIHGKVAKREVAEALEWAKSNRALLAARFKELQQ